MKDLWIVLGSGGVGKTTSSAALGLAQAKAGRKVAVITVDPAKRLAQVLGLKTLSNAPQLVKSYDNGGQLSALWLDNQNALEELLRKHAAKLPGLDKLLGHRLFKIIQTQLGGIEEYLGVEKVVALGQSADFDLCILDTPPSKHALDFLEAPRHLLKFFDEGVLKVFLNEGKSSDGGFFSRVFQSGTHQMIEIFKNFLGSVFLSELAELLNGLRPVRKIFTNTAETIESWVRLPSTHFIVVSLLEDYPLDEARLLKVELSSRGLKEPSLLVLNKCLPQIAIEPAALTEALGAEASASIVAQLKNQSDNRKKIPSFFGPQTITAELSRTSVRGLTFAQLENMGQELSTKWPANLMTPSK
jgi:anion-transporting  ArsA/GET3 family ATPase